MYDLLFEILFIVGFLLLSIFYLLHLSV